MFDVKLVPFVSVFIVICFLSVRIIRPKSCKKEEGNEESIRRQKTVEIERQITLQRKQAIALVIFGVSLDRINEKVIQDKIVDRVNSLAIQVSEANVNYDKATRGEEVTQPPVGGTWNKQVASLKGKWRTRRNFALRIAPELEDRMPNYSVFIPLENQNEECG
jgi:hypothetical protein